MTPEPMNPMKIKTCCQLITATTPAESPGLKHQDEFWCSLRAPRPPGAGSPSKISSAVSRFTPFR
jgi:hypothetical protein